MSTNVSDSEIWKFCDKVGQIMFLESTEYTFFIGEFKAKVGKKENRIMRMKFCSMGGE